MALTEREQALIECVEWLRNTAHEVHHMTTISREGQVMRVPDQHRRSAEDCGSVICQYATKIITKTRSENGNGAREEARAGGADAAGEQGP